MLILDDDGSFVAIGVKDFDAELDVGDDVAALTATNPGVDGPFGVLDYMSVVSWVAFGFPAEDATEATFEFGLGHMGLATPEADIPVAGDADYAGDFVGIYVEPGFDVGGFVAVATGDAAFTADFGLGTVEGGVFEIDLAGTDLDGNAFAFEDVGDILFDAVTIGSDGFGGATTAGNTFAGNVVPGLGEDAFAGFDEASIGTVDATFYGPNNGMLEGPEEVGAVLTLENADGSGDFISGVIGAIVVE